VNEWLKNHCFSVISFSAIVIAILLAVLIYDMRSSSSEISRLNEANDRSEAETEELNRTIREQRDEITSAQRKIREFEREKTASIDTVERLKAEASSLPQAEIDKLKEDLAEQKATISDLKSDIERQNSIITEQKETIQALETERLNGITASTAIYAGISDAIDNLWASGHIAAAHALAEEVKKTFPMKDDFSISMEPVQELLDSLSDSVDQLQKLLDAISGDRNVTPDIIIPR
jgi:chromosome segregation ATPase